MMKPVRAVADFMVSLDDVCVEHSFVAEPVIVENFAPYIFRGHDAFLRWRRGFHAHADDGSLSGLKVAFEPAQDYSRTGDTVYFVLPTTWTGRTAGKPFEEHGGWSFVLTRHGGDWRVACYAWAVTAYRLLSAGFDRACPRGTL
jgi:hypothetical protein